MVGKTNVPEFSFEGYTANRLFGPTRNPWAPEWSPGGSSGGSGAAIVTGMAPIATGSDGGGSVRIPAAFCGILGIKPTNGVVARDPIPSWIDYSTKGPMATTVADLRLLFDVLRGPAPGDPTALPALPGGAPPIRRLLASPRIAAHGPVPPEIETLFDRAVEAFAASTALPVEWVDPPLDAEVDAEWFTICAPEELAWIGRDLVQRRRDELTPVMQAIVHLAERVTLDDYLTARRRRFQHVRILDRLLADDAVLLTPTMCVEGFTADGRMPGADREGTPSDAYNTQAQNVTGHPAISLPAGLSPNGVPFGLQLTAPRLADERLLELAECWERTNPWPVVAPGFGGFAEPFLRP